VRVDGDQVDAGLDQPARLGADFAVDPDRGGDAQPALRVDRGGVDAGPDRAGAGQHAGQLTGRIGQHRHIDRGVFEQVEDLVRVGAGRCGDEIVDGDVADPGEPVHPGAGGLGDDPDRAALEHHHGGAVRALVDQRERIGHRVVRRQLDRGVGHQVPALDEVDGVRDRRERQVLGSTTRPPRRAMVSAIRRPGPLSCWPPPRVEVPDPSTVAGDVETRRRLRASGKMNTRCRSGRTAAGGHPGSACPRV
jgi:hypothetical protein